MHFKYIITEMGEQVWLYQEVCKFLICVNGLYFEKKVTPKQRALDNFFTVAAGKGHSLHVL